MDYYYYSEDYILYLLRALFNTYIREFISEDERYIITQQVYITKRNEIFKFFNELPIEEQCKIYYNNT